MARQKLPDAGRAPVDAIRAPLEYGVIGKQVGGLPEVALVRVIAKRFTQALDLGDGLDVGRFMVQRHDAGLQGSQAGAVGLRQASAAMDHTQQQASRQEGRITSELHGRGSHSVFMSKGLRMP